MTQTLLAIAIAIVLDQILGEARRWHPLAGFGALAKTAEKHLYRNGTAGLWRGGAATILLIVPLTLAAMMLEHVLEPWPWAGLAFQILVLYLAIGARSLADHGSRVQRAMAEGNIDKARLLTGCLVSRDTARLDREGLSKATIESILENGCDAIFAPLFWFLVGGAPLALLYRLVNTLDAMWGYKNSRYIAFGRFAARLDDVLNFIPARLTALTYAIAGRFGNALSCWHMQAPAWKSPNAGPVMSAGAGALCLQLGGPASYGGEIQQRPPLGGGQRPSGQDITRAISLVRRSLALWLLAIVIMMIIIEAGGKYHV